MKIKVFMDGNDRIYSQEEVEIDAKEYMEDCGDEMVERFVKYINSVQNINPLFLALRDNDSETFLDLCRRFQDFLDSYKKAFIDENFYESYLKT